MRGIVEPGTRRHGPALVVMVNFQRRNYQRFGSF